MKINFEFMWHSGVFLLLCLVLFFVAQLCFRLINRRIHVNNELTGKDNLSFYMGYAGYFLGFRYHFGCRCALGCFAAAGGLGRPVGIGCG